MLASREVLALSFGAMIGWSWVLLTGHWIATAGSVGAIAAFVIGGVAIALIGLLYSELAAAMPRAGGEHVYTHRALGRHASFACSWALLMAYGTVAMFESVALPTALQFLWPNLQLATLWQVAGADVDLAFVLIGTGSAALMTWVNLRGIKTAAIVQSIVTALILLSGAVLVSGAGLFGDWHTLAPSSADVFTGTAGLAAVVMIVPAMLVGFDVIPQSAEEIDVPPKWLGTLLIISVLMAVLWYVLIVAAVATSGVAVDAQPGDLATAQAAQSLWGAIGSGGWASTLLVIGGIGGIMTSWNAFIIGGSRVMFAMAHSGWLPAGYKTLHPAHRTPHLAILTIGALTCLSPLFGRTILVWLVDAGSFAIVVAFVFVAIAFLVLRWREPDMDRPFRVPAGGWVGGAALLCALGLLSLFLPGSPSALGWPAEWLIVLSWAVVGVLVWTRYRGAGR